MTFLALWSVLPREQIWEDFVSCHMKIDCSVFQDIFNINKSGNNPGVCVLYINKNIFWEGTLAELHIDDGTVVLEKTLESPLDCKEIQPVHPKGDQSWVFIGRTDVEGETPIFWPPDVKSWLIWKEPVVGKDWRQEEKGMTQDEMVGWHHWLNGHEFGWTPGVDDGQRGLACCHSFLLLPSIFPSIRVFSDESALHIRWPKYWSFSFNISPSNENSGLISFRMDRLDLLAVQGTLKSLLQHHSSKASILWRLAFFIV